MVFRSEKFKTFTQEATVVSEINEISYFRQTTMFPKPNQAASMRQRSVISHVSLGVTTQYFGCEDVLAL